MRGSGNTIGGPPRSTSGTHPRCRAWGAFYPLALAAVMLLGSQTTQAQMGYGVALQDEDFRQIGEQGFGERGTSRAWSQAYFKGKLYIGTNYNFLCIIRSGAAAGNNDNPEVPVECEERLIDNDLRARIYRYDPATNQVELVYISPTTKALLSDGTRVDVALDSGYRTMQVVTESDGSEALYVGTFTTTRVPQPPARILRTEDGENFEEVALSFPNRNDTRSFRSFTLFNGRFYALALGTDLETLVIESDDPRSGQFRVVEGPGYDPSFVPFDLEPFAGFLYIGAFTPDGFELMKTQAAGRPPYTFHRVLTQGAYRGPANQTVLSMGVFKNHLYVGSGIYYGSLTLIEDFKPAAAEVLRVAANDSWDIVCGDERATPDGYKVPLSGRRPGFGNPFNGYIWQIVEHNGVLYTGTLDTAILAQYAQGLDGNDLQDLGDLADYPQILDVINQLGPDEVADVISAVEGGFDLYSSTDGVTWQNVSRVGLGDGFSMGVRTLRSTPLGLFVGSDNPFFGLRLFLGQPPATDSDGDSYLDGDDNCPLEWNLNQADLDGDGIGDVCDPDQDGDCLPDELDAQPRVAQPAGSDTDADTIPDACDNDDDADSVIDRQDNCILAANLSQADADGDGIGDACEAVVDPPDDPNDPGDDPGTRPLPGTCGATGTAALLLTFAGLLGLNLAGRRSLREGSPYEVRSCEREHRLITQSSCRLQKPVIVRGHGLQ